MTNEEASFCMKQYLPDSDSLECMKCPYYHTVPIEGTENGFTCKADEAHKMAIKALEQTKWITVSERLPKESDGIVLITVNGKVKTGKYSEFSNTWYKGDMCGVGGDDPIAWKPLPEPYKAESEIHCNCTDAEIAKSFIEDVEAVKDLLTHESEEV